MIFTSICLVLSTVFMFELKIKPTLVAFILSTYFAVIIVTTWIFGNAIVWIVLTTAGIALLLLISKGKTGNQVFTYFTTWLFLEIINKFAYVVSILVKPDIDFILYITLSIAYFFSTKRFFINTFKAVYKYTANRKWLVYSIYPIVSNALLTYFLTPVIVNLSLLTNILILVLLIVILFVYHIIFNSISIAYENSLDRQKLDSIRHHLSKQKEYYTDLIKYTDEIKYIRHNLRFHISTLQALMANGDVAAANDYMINLSNLVEKMKARYICENIILNAMLSTYISFAEMNSIKVEPKVSIQKEINIEDLDLCVIFGNCLENAIEACKKTDSENDRLILVRCMTSNGNLIAFFQNPSMKGNIAFNEDNIPQSSKENGGLGLKSVKAIVDKYKGDISIINAYGVFTVCIEMPLR